MVLNERMDAAVFRQLVESWAVKCRAKESWPEKWGTVDVRQYYHEFSLDEIVPEEKKRPCRDSRYKFDRPAREAWDAAAGDPNSDGFKLIQFLNKCHINEAALLSEGEFKQLTDLYLDAETRQRSDRLAGKAQSDPALVPDALRSLWLSGFPWPEPEEKLARADALEMPAGRVAIRDWVYAETKVLQPNVMRSITEDIDSLVDVLEWAGAAHGRAVFDDFRLRVRNESSLMWNDVRRGRVVTTVKRKWNHPDTTSPADADGEEGN